MTMILHFIRFLMRMATPLAGGTMISIGHGIDQSNRFELIFIEEFVRIILRDGQNFNKDAIANDGDLC